MAPSPSTIVGVHTWLCYTQRGSHVKRLAFAKALAARDSNLPAEPHARMDPQPQRITRHAIQVAREEFERLAHAAAETEEGGDFGDVVIAHNVTRQELDRVPVEWLRGVRVMLCADGTLVITKLETEEHRNAVQRVMTQLQAYADANRLRIRQAPLVLRNGAVVQPDIALFTWPADPNVDSVAIALFAIEVTHRSVPEMIQTADRYLELLPSVARVVFLKIFPPRRPWRHQVRIPALAVVFRRAATRTRTEQIEVAQMQSFGNTRIHHSVLHAFVRPRAGSPLVPFPHAVNHSAAARQLPAAFNVATLNAELIELNYSRIRIALSVNMPRGLPAIRVNLVRAYVGAIIGWNDDENRS